MKKIKHNMQIGDRVTVEYGGSGTVVGTRIWSVEIKLDNREVPLWFEARFVKRIKPLGIPEDLA